MGEGKTRRHRFLKSIVLEELSKAPRLTGKKDPFLRILAEWNADLRVPSVASIAKAFPGKGIIKTPDGYWLLLRGSRPHRPDPLLEASDVYYDAGGECPGPFQWYEDLLLAKRGTFRNFSYRSTLFFPIDLLANLDEQIRWTRDFCRAARKKLIAVSGRRLRKRGRKREVFLATNILMLVLRHWGGETISSIANRFFGSTEEPARQLTTRRIYETKALLLTHAINTLPARLRRTSK